MRAVKMLICIFFVFVLAACGGEPSVAAVPAYLEAFVSMDYEAMWDYCQPDSAISKEAFVQKYEAIFSGLGVTDINISGLTEPDEDGIFYYTATYHTKEYGSFSNDFVLKTIPGRIERRVHWSESLIFPEMEEGSNVRVRTLQASRGEIFDADGGLLAANTYADTLYMDVARVENIMDVAQAVQPLTALNAAEVIKKYENALAKETQIVVLGAFPPNSLDEEQKQSILSIDGLGIDNRMYTPIRDYVLGESAAHIIGYLGYGDEKTLPEGYTVSDKLGLSGLEASYETQLKGKDGKIVCIEDRWGKNIRTLYEQPMEQGQDLRLTIKPQLQRDAYDLLVSLLGEGQSGAAIVMDASTGFVEAMASYPSFDNNLFTFPVSKETWDYLMAAESNQPLFSRATQGLYPPGSVLKPFTAAAALQAGVLSVQTEFTGEIIDNKWTPDESDWKYPPITRVDDSGSPLKMDNAMVNSDNIYFAFAALKLGQERFFDYLESIGMKSAASFDLPLKQANLVNPTSMVTRKLLADMGYGQGELLVTPLQLTAMYSAFANGKGDMMQPVLVQKICRIEGEDYKTLSERAAAEWVSGAVEKSSLRILAPMLEDVVQNGTGKPVRIRGVGIAGKTGTAEIGDDKSREISWFAGYWTKGYYDRLVVVMVDVATKEGGVKFDIAKALLSP